MTAASRYDQFKANGLGMPDTFEELEQAMKVLHKKDGVAAYAIENHWGWTFIPFLQGFGGNVFRNPPDDLMPTLDTPEVAEAAEYFARLINSYGPEAALWATRTIRVTEERCAGRVNYSPQPRVLCAPLGEEGSKVTKTCSFGIVPRAEGPLSRCRIARLGHSSGARRTRMRPGNSQVVDVEGVPHAPGPEAWAGVVTRKSIVDLRSTNSAW
jgi:multiple sugar transport system substrate-binding protein